jgi:methylated-DNA-[protein]-cysteine S-methyltransferase
MFDTIINTPLGNIGIKFHLAQLSRIEFLSSQLVPFPYVTLSPRLKKIVKRVESYFSHPQSLVDLPYDVTGSLFQRKVWLALSKIPLGQTITYGELAKKLNTAARAVGSACRTNPLPLVIPCHRVVAANNLGGFCGHTSGAPLAHKEWLLVHEQRTC